MDTLIASDIAKIIGAVGTFALGIWIGLGRPGMKTSRQEPGGRIATYRGTWINRVFFNMPRSTRRFDARRLVVPKRQSPKKDGAAAGKQ